MGKRKRCLCNKRSGAGAIIILPPAIADQSDNRKGGKGKIKNAGVQAFGGLFTQLLSCFGTNGALRHRLLRGEQEENERCNKYQRPLFHSRQFLQSYGCFFGEKRSFASEPNGDFLELAPPIIPVERAIIKVTAAFFQLQPMVRRPIQAFNL